MTRVRSIGAALALLLVVGASPAALLVWGVSVTAIGNLLRPDDGTALLAVLTMIGWLAWAAFTLSVAVEAFNVLARRAVPIRLPLLGGMQAIAGALVFAALSPVGSAAAVPPPPMTTEAVAGSVTTTGEHDDAARSAVAGYLVRSGDDLWSIAEQVLGDGGQWRRLADANPDLLANPTVDLVPGVRLVLPSDADRPDEAHHRAARAHTVTVVRGDTLSGLAKEHLGDQAKWPRIYRANAERIADPDEIDVGWKLVIPTRSNAESLAKQARPPRKSAPTLHVQPRVDQPVPSPSTTGPAGPSVAAQPAPEQPVEQATAEVNDPAWPLIGGLGAAAAAMILTGVAMNRAGQLRARPLGRRISHPPVDVRLYETALGHRERPDSPLLLEKALRHLGAHVHASGQALPPIEHVILSEVGLAFHWRLPAGEAPEPFRVVGSAWMITAQDAGALPSSTHPVPFPALVTLGRDQAGSWFMVDLESSPPLALTGSRPLRHAAAAAMAVELSCSPWAAELNVIVVGGDEMFVRAACPELVRFDADPEAALATLKETARQRSDDESPTALVRVDPDRAEAGAAQVLLFADEPSDDLRARMLELIDPDLGISGVLGGSGNWALVLHGSESDPSAAFTPAGVSLTPQLIAAHTRAAIGTIFAATAESAHEPAHWWAEQEKDNVRTLVPRRQADHLSVGEHRPSTPTHPYLKLFGPIELAGTAGPAPARSRRQCEEYCAWLLENPSSTATRMANELVVAETTRRSNMSRLRSWLGNDPTAQAYLPEAYSGRISLHPQVGSDWQRMKNLIAPGLNRLTAETLVDVLELVRGAPLADAAPGQWRWAEELRTDMASVARDAGVLLTRWAIDHRDLDLARWAAARALLAAPEDELLLVERIHTEHLAGNTGEVERLVRWVTGQARVLGVDLAPETVDACQRVMEGRTRPRAAR